MVTKAIFALRKPTDTFEFSLMDLKNAIQTLGTNKAVGVDGIKDSVFKVLLSDKEMYSRSDSPAIKKNRRLAKVT